jgi:hypothetical protein
MPETKGRITMPRSLPIVCAVLLGSSASAYGAGYGLKPGLWEVKVVSTVIDGVDKTAQMSGMLDKMRQMMASLPPDQRAQMEARLKQSGVSQGSDGGFQVCVTAEMAKRDRPILDREGHCQPASVVHNGNQTSYAFSCSANGSTTSGKGVATANGDVITAHVDMSTHEANGQSHLMEQETQLTFVGTDCGDVKPQSISAPASATSAPPASAVPETTE